MGKDRKLQRGEILKASSNPNFWALCLDSYNWFMMCSSTPRSSSRIARRNALAPLCRGNNNSLCWDSRYSWSKHQQEASGKHFLAMQQLTAARGLSCNSRLLPYLETIPDHPCCPALKSNWPRLEDMHIKQDL